MNHESSPALYHTFEVSNEDVQPYHNITPPTGYCCMKQTVDWKDMPDRSIYTSRPDYMLPNNRIETSKYNFITFLPKNLKEQLMKLNNVYFLVIGGLEMIPDISTSAGIPVIWLPLVVIMLITALKDLLEDLQRHRSDRDENQRKVLRLGPQGAFEEVHWEEIRVGEIIKVSQDEYFPSDMILLRSSEKTCVAYIETKNLDGETNLKMKTVTKELGFIQEFDEKGLRKLRIRADYEKPNPYLYNFIGSIENLKKEKVPLDQNNFILRGCSLRNTAWIYGLVTYTGHDTKIMLNSIKARPKQSRLEKQMQQQILLIFILQICVCIFSAFYAAIWYVVHKSQLPYLVIDQNGIKDNNFAYNFFVRLGNWLMILTNFVPISLLVTLEMVKFLQGIFLASDPKMMSMPTKTYVKVQTSTLNEELGQVQYIFSDKTGTLTCNIMEFKKISINGISYGDDKSMKEAELKTHPKVTNVDFKDRNFFSDMENSSSPNHNAVHMALLHLSLCHTTLCELSSNNEFIYNASSPDELALVNYAKYCGYEFQGKDEENYMSVRMPDGHIRKFELLHVLEFNSTRKRMSVIIKDPITNELLLLTKGADSMLHPRLKNQESDLVDKTFSHLEEYANIGLRTLVLAQKVLQPQEYESWLKLYIEASSAIKDREVGVMSLQEDIEKGLELIAATAIEDKLQDQVGITIKSLKKAGINIWVLTGDKLETAINIGYSCKLLSDDQEKIIIDGQEEVEIDQNIQDGFKILANRPKDPPENFCLIITGDALKHAIKDNFSKSLIQLSDRCSTVIACRMSPKQKQEVVSLIKSNKPDVTTLAIGDGANDVNMITAAHVGIGIRGVEGQQAARASDYAIGEFKVLRRLLLNHGREYYRRNSTLICYNFFKNMILVLPQFWFAFYDGFSGVSFYDQYLFQLFNLFYTSLPIFVYSLMDKEYSGTYLTRNPQLYAQGIKGLLFKKRVFWMWMFMGVWQSLLLTYFVMFSLENINLYKNFPYQTNIMITGMIIYGATILNTNVKIILFSNIYTPICMFFIWGSILFFVSNYAIESTFVQDSEVYDTFNLVYGSSYFYLLMLLICGVTNVLDSAFIKLLDFRHYQKTGEQKVTVEVKGELSEEEKEAIRELEKAKISLQEQHSKHLVDSLEIIAPAINNVRYSLNKEENKEFDEGIIKRSNSLYRNSLTNRKYTGYAFSQVEPIDEKLRRTYQN